MPKRKHKKKQVIVPCSDANELVRKSIAEKARVAAAIQKKYDMLKAQYEAEMTRKNADTSTPTPKPEMVSPSGVFDIETGDTETSNTTSQNDAVETILEWVEQDSEPENVEKIDGDGSI